MRLDSTTGHRLVLVKRLGRIFAVLVAVWGLLGCAMGQSGVPAQSSWIDEGLVLDTGPFGASWDAIMEGITPCGVVQKGGTYFLYYVAADNYIDDPNNVGPAHRSVGVATSSDAIHWTKHAGNPVLTFSSSGNPEEGAVSCGVHLDLNGDFIVYYGANIASNPTTSSVNADSRMAVSSDGFDFSGADIVLNHSDSSVWGSGDELHAVAAYSDGANWYAYYIPNGSPQGSKLGVAWGSEANNLSASAPVLEGSNNVRARGPLSIVPLDGETVAFFVSYRGQMDVRLTSPTSLDQLGTVVENYDFPSRATVFLDSERRTWFMYYNQWSYMAMRVAPDGAPDTSPPTAPPNLAAAAVNHHETVLSWDAAADLDTGVLRYNIYRNGSQVGTTRDFQFNDRGLSEQTSYTYEVRAVNLHGTEGADSQVVVTTPADTTPPAVVAVSAGGDPNRVRVLFDETLELTSAETASHYTLDKGVLVSGAQLAADLKTVMLTTSGQRADEIYTLTVRDVLDSSAGLNAADTQATYTYSSFSGLIAHWKLDETEDPSVTDTSGFSHHGSIKGNPVPVSGKVGGALDFDGILDYVEIDDSEWLDTATEGSFTVAAWVRIDDVPADTGSTSWGYTFFSGPGMSLSYDRSQQFVGKIQTTSGNFDLASSAVAPGSFHHLALVKDSAAKTMHLFVDGVEVEGSPSPYTGEFAHSSAPEGSDKKEYWSRYRLGVADPLYHYQSNFTKGSIDDVRAYDRALTPAEIQSLSSTEASWIQVPFDIRPQVCPNPLEIEKNGRLTVAITGTADFDPSAVDVAAIQMAGERPLSFSYSDQAAPFFPFSGKQLPTDCTSEGADGWPDLTLKFDNRKLVTAIETELGRPLVPDELLIVPLDGQLLDGTPIYGEDVVLVEQRGGGSGGNGGSGGGATEKNCKDGRDNDDDGVIDCDDSDCTSSRWCAQPLRARSSASRQRP